MTRPPSIPMPCSNRARSNRLFPLGRVVGVGRAREISDRFGYRTSRIRTEQKTNTPLMFGGQQLTVTGQEPPTCPGEMGPFREWPPSRREAGSQIRTSLSVGSR